MKLKSILTFCVLSTLLMMGCKKDKSTLAQEKQPKCRITSYTEIYHSGGSPSTWTITYNSDGKISHISTNAYREYSYTYTAHSVILVFIFVNETEYQATYTKDNQGRTTNIKTEYYNSDGSPRGWANYAFSYNGNLASHCVVSFSSGGSSFTADYTWENGNLTALVSNGSPILSVDYYKDKPSQSAGWMYLLSHLMPGDNFDQVFDGLLSVVHNKNLSKSITYGGVLKPNYIFDSDGKISTISFKSGDEYNFQYDCK